MRARLLPLMALTALIASCGVVSEATDDLARDQARSTVNRVVADRFPGVNAAPVTDCIIDAADASEILSLAGASVTGVTDRTVQNVLDIAARPEAVTCLARNSLSLL
ncbi:succinate dehydrogenase [Alterinioella nitratireducens]|uniref:succinate dehydrogenase n=1 Tax=Alterinioella nitratireducens TaxID=2735915 RepID=UPI0015536520|nr:succinate dehydrogenase [Alterinioella nitratireducens]NPD19388.1 succinate dehydrogenase [Alterinioella nitratireducens]